MFEINPTKIKGGCQSGRKVVTHDSKSDLPLTAQTDFHSVSEARSMSFTLFWFDAAKNFTGN